MRRCLGITVSCNITVSVRASVVLHSEDEQQKSRDHIDRITNKKSTCRLLLWSEKAEHVVIVRVVQSFWVFVFSLTETEAECALRPRRSPGRLLCCSGVRPKAFVSAAFRMYSVYTSTACVFSCGSFLWFSTAVVYLIKEKSTQTCVRSFLFFMYSAVRYVIGGRAVD